MSFFYKLSVKKEKNLFFSLCLFFGLNLRTISFLFAKLGLNRRFFFSFKDLDSILLERLEFFIENFFLIELVLKKNILFDIFLLKSIKNFRGLRHFKKLPLRGQRTKTNSRTVRRLKPISF